MGKYTYTFPADTTGALDDDNASSFLVNFWLHAGSTYNSGTLATSWASKTEANRAVGADSFFSSTDNELFLTGVQLEVGSTATPFEHRAFGEEVALCKGIMKLMDMALIIQMVGILKVCSIKLAQVGNYIQGTKFAKTKKREPNNCCL